MTRLRLKQTLESSIGGLWGSEPTGGTSDIPVVRVADFDYDALVAGKPATKRAVEPHLAARRLLCQGDLLIEKSGGGERQNVGRVVQWVGSEPAICSNFIAVLRPSTSMDARWLAYLHRSLYLAGFAAACTKQTTGIQNLDLAAYLGARVDVPRPGIQSRVADFLDRESARVERLQDAVRRAQARHAEYRDALITEAVTGKLDVSRLSQSQLDESAHAAMEAEGPEVSA